MGILEVIQNRFADSALLTGKSKILFVLPVGSQKMDIEIASEYGDVVMEFGDELIPFFRSILLIKHYQIIVSTPEYIKKIYGLDATEDNAIMIKGVKWLPTDKPFSTFVKTEIGNVR